MIQRELKSKQIEEVKDRFARCTAAVVMDFRGISVEKVTELRSKFRDAGVEYRVVKNNLVKKAVSGSGFDSQLLEHLKGPTGIAWSFEDPSIAAKIVRDFRKEGENGEKLQVKCGVLGQQFLTGSQVESELASLPSKDEMRAMLLATLMAPAQHLVRQIQAPAQNFAYLLDARQRQGGS